MRRDDEWARERFGQSRVGRLATVSADGRPHLVPVTFALTSTGLVTAVDAKPKSSNALRRLENIAANPDVSVLVDEYSEDWSQLWWARADGRARVVPAGDDALAGLVDRYEQYRIERPPGPVIVIEVRRWSGWSAS